MAQTIGVVLAGGQGRRMGGPKGEILVGDVALAERAARALHPICGNVLISVGVGRANPAPSYTAVTDTPPAGRGPLAGIAAAFATTGRADLLVLACDYPSAETDLLLRLRNAAKPEDDLVLPVDPGGRDHPLVALWRRSAEPRVVAALAEGSYKVRALFPELALRRLGPESFPELDLRRALRNVNRPADLEAFAD